jgi:antitoxin ParD1/3/4
MHFALRETMSTYAPSSTMSLRIPPEFERAVMERVESGQYPDAESVLMAMVAALDREASDEAERLDTLRREIQVGIDQADRGEVIDGPTAYARLRERARQRD